MGASTAVIVGLVVGVLLFVGVLATVGVLLVRAFSSSTADTEVPVTVVATVRPVDEGVDVQAEVTAVSGTLPRTVRLPEVMEDPRFIDVTGDQSWTSGSLGTLDDLTLDGTPVSGREVRLPHDTRTVTVGYRVRSTGTVIVTVSSPLRGTRAQSVEVRLPEQPTSCLVPSGNRPNTAEVAATTCPSTNPARSTAGPALDPDYASFGDLHPWVRVRF
ncbi:MAG: hypothetical protein IPM00_16255 [Tetrasphaera sp.]|nr:hypothetical protein [Tetrasphaera sp.]